MSKEIVEVHVIFRGRVQGVFFRDTTRSCAQQLGVTGTVRNVPDGSVELYAQGNRENLDRLLDKLKGSAGPGYVDSAEIKFSAPERVFDGFRVVY